MIGGWPGDRDAGDSRLTASRPRRTIAAAGRSRHDGFRRGDACAQSGSIGEPGRGDRRAAGRCRTGSRASRIYGGTPLVLIALDVQDPGNVGAIVRVAEAGGASGVVCAGACADPFGWKALRGSMGSALRLPILVHRDSREAIDEARRHGCRIVATAPRGGRPLFDADLRGPIAVLIGGEGSGPRGVSARRRLTSA